MNARRNRFNPDSVAEMKRVGKANEPWIFATATVGMSKLGAVIARQVYSAAGRKFENCDTVEKAMDWLVQLQPAPG